MPYVMVPVPEEHVEDVMQFVLRAMARASLQPWDTAAMTEFFLEIDEPGRMLLSVVARAVIRDRQLGEDEVTDMVELSRREIVGIIQELNDRAQAANRGQVLFRRRATEVLPNGRTREKPVVGMDPQVAVLVQEAERAELAGEARAVDSPV